MSKNHNHQLDDAPQIPASQENQISEDPRDGSRLTGKPPPQDGHNEATIEEFGERNMGVAAQE